MKSNTSTSPSAVSTPRRVMGSAAFWAERAAVSPKDCASGHADAAAHNQLHGGERTSGRGGRDAVVELIHNGANDADAERAAGIAVNFDGRLAQFGGGVGGGAICPSGDDGLGEASGDDDHGRYVVGIHGGASGRFVQIGGGFEQVGEVGRGEQIGKGLPQLAVCVVIDHGHGNIGQAGRTAGAIVEAAKGPAHDQGQQEGGEEHNHQPAGVAEGDDKIFPCDGKEFHVSG